MARAAANWERLVRAALRGDRLAGAFGVPVTGIAGNVPSSLVCEHAYTLAQSLDPNSEGRGVLQFKTGLMSVIRVEMLATLFKQLAEDVNLLLAAKCGLYAKDAEMELANARMNKLRAKMMKKEKVAAWIGVLVAVSACAFWDVFS